MPLAIQVDPVHWITGHIPRNLVQLEKEFRNVLKIVFWAALLAPVVILPAYYFLLAILH